MKKVYRVGYVGLLEDAPLHVALSQGLFGDEGYTVELSCELGWAALTSKLSNGALAAANVSALYPLLPSLGHQPGSTPLEVLTLTAFSGLSVTLAVEFKDAIKSRDGLPKPLRIGVSIPRGDSYVVLNAWMKSIGMTPEDAVLVPLAASQFIDALAESYVHGFIASDPITTQAEVLGKGAAVARSHALIPFHPRTAIAVKAPLVNQDPEFCRALKSVVRKARAYCARPENWPVVQEVLNRELRGRGVVGAPHAAIDVFGSALLPHTFFERSSPSRQELEPAGVDFLRRACFATDPGYRDHDVRAAIQKVYRESLEFTATASDLRPAYS